MSNDKLIVRSKKEKKAIHIAKVAAKLFSKKGFLETSITDIAKSSRMSKANIYYYFEDKNYLLTYILNSFFDTILSGTEVYESQNLSWEEKLKLFIKRHVDIYVQNTPQAKVLFKEVNNLDLKNRKIMRQKERKYFEILRNIVAGYLGDKVPKEYVTALTFFILGACNWMYLWYDPKKKITPEKISEMIFQVFKNGISSFIH
ncbi:MAG: TetR/AcrR family transcriptional regulator [Desulfobacterota bacterium]|nr:TetR/AcrR family transcriptional regulator [Thermodesulfobacteriota bacterium]MDW8001378.1 TetR family transcriptional regulator [Deltaproteobacteria bacterium]